MEILYKSKNIAKTTEPKKFLKNFQILKKVHIFFLAPIE